MMKRLIIGLIGFDVNTTCLLDILVATNLVVVVIMCLSNRLENKVPDTIHL